MSTSGEMPTPAGRGRGPIIAVGIAALALVVLLIPGVLLSVGGSATTPRASEAERQLERQIKEFERQLGGDVCRAEPQTPTLRPPGEEGGTSPKPGTERPSYTVPVPPREVPVPEGVAPGQATRPANLADLLERTTVFIIVRKPDGPSTGSGFFVAPDLVLTNAHVVDRAQDIRVGNKAMQRLVTAQVIARAGPSRPDPDGNFQFGLDYALLRLPGNQASGHLTFAENPPAKLQNVVASGYPGVILGTDPVVPRLERGDPTAIPESSLTQGAVMVVQRADLPMPIVVHRASISGGNSGGPLTDECGRVVGVNTWGRQAEKADHQNLAQGSKSALAFLKENGVTPQVVPGQCVIAQAQAPTPAPAAKPGAGPTAPPPPGAAPKPGGEKGK